MSPPVTYQAILLHNAYKKLICHLPLHTFMSLTLRMVKKVLEFLILSGHTFTFLRMFEGELSDKIRL